MITNLNRTAALLTALLLAGCAGPSTRLAPVESRTVDPGLPPVASPPSGGAAGSGPTAAEAGAGAGGAAGAVAGAIAFQGKAGRCANLPAVPAPTGSLSAMGKAWTKPSSSSYR